MIYIGIYIYDPTLFDFKLFDSKLKFLNLFLVVLVFLNLSSFIVYYSRVSYLLYKSSFLVVVLVDQKLCLLFYPFGVNVNQVFISSVFIDHTSLYSLFCNELDYVLFVFHHSTYFSKLMNIFYLFKDPFLHNGLRHPYQVKHRQEDWRVRVLLFGLHKYFKTVIPLKEVRARVQVTPTQTVLRFQVRNDTVN